MGDEDRAADGRLAGSVAVVTGASSGIGLELAKALVAEGARVVLAARREERLQAAVAQLNETAGADVASHAVTDVTVEADIERLAQHTLDRHGRVDVLVNNAGRGYAAGVHQIDGDQLDAVMAVNFKGAVLCTKHFIKPMASQRSGVVVNLGSVSSKTGFPQGTPYVASKFALRGFSQCLALEVKNFGIRVMDVYPDFVDSEFFEAMGFEYEHASTAIPASAVADVIVNALCLPANAHVTEVEIRPPNLGKKP